MLNCMYNIDAISLKGYLFKIFMVNVILVFIMY